jgi:hypothetical protein
LHIIAVALVPQSSTQPAPAQVHFAAPSQCTVQLPVQTTVQSLSPVQVAVV